MEKPFTAESGKKLLHDADGFLRENPVPAVLGALAVGFVIGLLVRAFEPKDSYDELRDRVEAAEDSLRSVLEPLAKRTKKGYKKAAGAVRDALEEAVDAAKKVDVEEYTDPVGNWFKGLFKKCCG